MESTQRSTNGWLDKENVVCNTMEYWLLSCKKEWNTFAATWIQLKTIVLNEISLFPRTNMFFLFCSNTQNTEICNHCIRQAWMPQGKLKQDTGPCQASCPPGSPACGSWNSWAGEPRGKGITRHLPDIGIGAVSLPEHKSVRRSRCFPCYPWH